MKVTEKTLHLSGEAVKLSTDKRDPGDYRRDGRRDD